MGKGARTRQERKEREETLAQLLEREDVRQYIEVTAASRAYVVAREMFGLFDDLTLLTLNRGFGFGKNRLRRYWDQYIVVYNEAKECYAPDKALDYKKIVDLRKDLKAVFHRELLALGVDTEAWEQEAEESRTKAYGV